MQMEKVERREEMEKMVESKKRENEDLFDWKTPFAHLFLAHGNNIIFDGSQDDEWHQALLDVVMKRGRKFVFTVQIINTNPGNITIGVVDRHPQRQKQSSHRSGNAVCYSGGIGQIRYVERGRCCTT